MRTATRNKTVFRICLLYTSKQVSNAIWDAMLGWFYETIYGAVADFFAMMGNMGADIFELDWVKATIRLFTLFGWALFVVGVVAVSYTHLDVYKRQTPAE